MHRSLGPCYTEPRFSIDRPLPYRIVVAQKIHFIGGEKTFIETRITDWIAKPFEFETEYDEWKINTPINQFDSVKTFFCQFLYVNIKCFWFVCGPYVHLRPNFDILFNRSLRQQLPIKFKQLKRAKMSIQHKLTWFYEIICRFRNIFLKLRKIGNIENEVNQVLN